MEINHYPKTNRLEINTIGVQVNPASLLVLGKTSKGDGRQRGKFGEGFVLGVLALVRAGYEVKFRNHEMSWTVSFESPDPGHPLAGNELLTFQSRQLPAREPDFKVEITGVTAEIWAQLKTLALFLEEPKASEKVVTTAGTLLLNPSYKGRVFVRGLYVRKFDDLDCGYDLSGVELDRDRQMIDEWKLHYALGDLWVHACGQDPELTTRVYGLMKAGAAETRNLHYHADDKLKKKMREQFEQENGALSVPVATSAEAKEVTRIGGKATIVSPVLKDLLAQTGLSIEESKKRLEGMVTKRWQPNDLVFGASEMIDRLEKVLPNIVVVTFAGETPTCQSIDDKKLVGVDHRMFEKSFKEVLAAAVAAEGQRLGKDPMEVLLDHIVGTEPVSEPLDECDECHERIPVTERSTVNDFHAQACSLYSHVEDAPGAPD